MKNDIIATLGPATADVRSRSELLREGARGFRLNTSHLTLDELHGWLTRLGGFLYGLRHFQRGLELNVSVTLDLQGSKWRIGKIAPVTLTDGQRVRFVPGERSAHAGELPVPHADFFAAAQQSGGEIALNDAKVGLQIKTIHADVVDAVVIRGGELSARKGISLPGTTFRAEGLSEKDRAIFAMAAGLDWARFAVSYVRDAAEMQLYRRDLPAPAHLTAKIERGTAVYDIMRIANVCDSLWLCRGDLGAELGLAEMARAAALIRRKVRMLPVPLYLAGQVLEHMVHAPAPTRSEVCCIYDALQAGYAGVVLSDETAIGKYPVEAVRAAAMFRKVHG